MFVQIVKINVKPGREADFKDAFRINYEGTIAEEGNLHFDVLQDPDDSTRFTIYEVFRSAEAVNEHRKTEHYRKTVELLEDIMSEPRTKEIYAPVMSASLEG